MSNLLFDERPQMFQPRLAFVLGGSDEAIVLQQIHYWTQKNVNIRDGYSWVYNSMAEWHKQFYWMSISTLKRVFQKLEKLNVLVTANYNKAKFDKTKWYRVDYDALDDLEHRLVQNEPTSGSDRTNGEGQNEPTNTIDYTKTTTSSSSTAPQIGSRYEQTGASLSAKKKEKLEEYVTELGAELVDHAIELMEMKATHPNFAFLTKILESYKAKQITTVEQALDVEKKFKKRHKQAQRSKVVQKETLPEWAKKPEHVPKGNAKTKNENLDAEINELLAQLNEGG